MFPVDSWGTKSGWMMSLLYRIAAKNLELFRDRHCRPFSPGILCVFPDLCVYGSCIRANGMLWFSICPTSSLVAARDFYRFICTTSTLPIDVVQSRINEFLCAVLVDGTYILGGVMVRVSQAAPQAICTSMF
jgi:hypothetical protein